ncbi:MAG: SGNH hydrolase domain-containing protein [Candidatus Limnocylindrales bacterium]
MQEPRASRLGRRVVALIGCAALLAGSPGGAGAGSVDPDGMAGAPTVALVGDPDGDGLGSAVEQGRTRTDPEHNDTDRDGIHDGLEDPDGDLLSNLGEQRFGTDPRIRDTDGDGRDDWHEDRDRDGRTNGEEQDAGPLPDGLRPSLERARGDMPRLYYLGCHSLGTDATVNSCSFRYGPTQGRKLVILTGDSHAAHWFPALDLLARSRGWHLMTMTRPACPVADVLVTPGDGRAKACSEWRRNVWRKIRTLEPDLVIATSLVNYRFRKGGRFVRDDRAWKAGVTRSLRQLGASGATVVMLGDVYPWGERGAIPCLQKRMHTDISMCERQRSHRMLRAVRDQDRIQRAAATAAGALYRTTRDIPCPNDPCPFVVDGVLMTRDGVHLTATYAKAVWRAFVRRIPDV